MTLPADDPQKKLEARSSVGGKTNAWHLSDYRVSGFGIALPNRRLKPVWSEMRRLRIA
jgi:hypothetical protein